MNRVPVITGALQAFKDYAMSEYVVDNVTSTSFKFTHTLKVTFDKKSGKALNSHTVNVAIRLYDRDLRLLHSDTLKFVNNVLDKKKADALVNISPKELENRFNAARRDIITEIHREYLERKQEINDKIDSLMMYENVGVKDHDVIQSAYKGELVQISSENVKQKFDM